MTDPWQEPVRGELFPSELRGLSGIEQLRLLVSGKVAGPPIGELTGMRPTEVGVGTATFTMPITGWLLVPQGMITGGVVAILADGPLGCAIHTALPAATGYTTTELSINMVRPAPLEGQLIARGRLVHASRQLGLTEVFVTDHDGRLIAHGTSRCAIFTPDPSIGPPPDDIPVTSRAADGWTPPYERPVIGTILDEEIFQTRSGLEIMEQFIVGELALLPRITSSVRCPPPRERARASSRCRRMDGWPRRQVSLKEASRPSLPTVLSVVPCRRRCPPARRSPRRISACSSFGRSRPMAACSLRAQRWYIEGAASRRLAPR